MALALHTPLPSLEGVDTWINGDPPIGTLKQKPLVVHFWSMSCFVSHGTIESLNKLRDTYGKRGVGFISIHQPRSASDTDVSAVKHDAMAEMKMTQPCAVDNEHVIVERFQNFAVPTLYVFDRNHKLRRFQSGDRGYERIEEMLDRVLSEPA